MARMNDSASEEPDFLRQAESTLDALQRRLDAFDPDELEADAAVGVLKITFSDGRKCILNRQAPARQLWLAEGAEAWHFALRAPGEWVDTKGRGELKSVLRRIIERKLGRAVEL